MRSEFKKRLASFKKQAFEIVEEIPVLKKKSTANEITKWLSDWGYGRTLESIIPKLFENNRHFMFSDALDDSKVYDPHNLLQAAYYLSSDEYVIALNDGRVFSQNDDALEGVTSLALGGDWSIIIYSIPALGIESSVLSVDDFTKALAKQDKK